MDITQVNGQLRGQWAGRDLRQGQAFAVVGLANPLPLGHQVAVQVANQGHRPAEPDAAEP